MKLEEKIEIIHKKTCDVFKVDYDSTFLKTKKNEYANARQVTMSIALNNLKCTLKEVGNFFGKDHTTVLHAKKVVNNFIATEPDFAYKYMNVEHFSREYFKIKKKQIISKSDVMKELKKLIYSQKNINLTINANKYLCQL